MFWLGFRYWRVARITIISVFCGSLIVGIALAAAGISAISLFWAFFGAGLLLFCWRRLAVLALPCALMAGIILGLWRGSNIMHITQLYQPYVEQKVVMSGEVVDDSYYDGKNQLIIALNNIVINNQSLPGSARISTIEAVKPRRGDVLEVSGKMYGSFGKYQAYIYYADVKIVKESEDPILQTRRNFSASVQNVMPSQFAALGLGFLIGEKSAIDDTLNNELKILGLTHIIVASGYNLTVLVRVAKKLFAKVSRFQMTFLSLLMIFGFVAIAGLGSSMGRAALVTVLSIWAAYYGRKIHPILIILLAAAITGMINPFYVWCDIGWWLSFLAFAGVLIFAPLLQSRIYKNKKPKLFGQLVIETIAAQLFATPLLVLVFGKFSVLSLVANLLTVPFVPFAMLFTFFAGTLGWLIPYVAWPAIVLIGYICQMVHLLACISWASIDLKISTEVFIVLYSFIVVMCFVLWQRTNHDYLSKNVVE